MSEAYNIIEEEFFKNAKIKVIGVGGGGGNMVNHMVEKNVKEVELISANTDAQALKANKAPIKVQLGTELTKGLGAGMKPEVGMQAAEENFEEIKTSLEDADLVFISAGMGGGTGTGAASVVAKAAKELGALTIGIVTKPFTFEGPKRKKLAEQGFDELKKECDSIVTIPNDKLLTIIDRKAGRRESFRKVDDVLFQAVTGISDMIISYGENDINVDFADLRTVMSHQGLALMGSGYDKGDNAAYNALKAATESPLLDNLTLDGAMGVLVNFTMSEDYPLVEIDESMSMLYDKVDEDADVIYGTTTDNDLEYNEIKVTIIATGFETLKESNNKNSTKIETPAKKATERTVQKVVGGDNLELSGDAIDIPTWMRQRRD